MSPLLIALFANIFSLFVGCVLILLMVSFVVQKLLSLCLSHLFIFAFISINLGGGTKKLLLQFMSVLCLCFPIILYYPALHLCL